MRKNGFTLIELLAVIVILAIIALIATPIILGIINDARKESQERSVELYASAIRNGIAAYQLREMKEVAAGTYTSETLPFDVEYDGDVECSTIELYEDGGVYVAGCEVNDVEVEYTYGTKQVAKGTMGICNPISVKTEGTYTAGDKYECDVDPNKEGYDYTFYVLTSATSGSVNLIMDSNININGEAVKEGVSDLGIEAWILEEDYPGNDWESGEYNSAYGPITAMNHIQTATAGWSNVNSQTINTFTSCDYDGKCTEQSMIEYKVNARMPYYSEINSYNSVTGNYAYLYDNLEANCYDDECTSRDGVHEEGITHVSRVLGYWTLSSFFYSAFEVHCYGFVLDNGVNAVDFVGVRPVINLSI